MAVASSSIASARSRWMPETRATPGYPLRSGPYRRLSRNLMYLEAIARGP